MNDDTTTISDALTTLEASSPCGYKPFIGSVRSSVSQLLRRQGNPRDLQSYTVTLPFPQFGLFLTPVLPDVNAQKHILELLGYHGNPGTSGQMWLDDFERRRPILEQFVELTAHVVCVSQGDPAGEIVLPDQVDLPSAVAYFSYHFHIRLELLDIHPPPEDILPTRRDVILSSIRAVESSTRKIGILKRGSDTYTEWEKHKESVLQHASRECETSTFPYPLAQEEKLNMSGFLLSELSLIASKRLVDLWQYGQNVGSLLSLTYRGWSTSPDGAETCLDTSCNIGEDAFTDEYMSRLQTVRKFLVACLESCAPDELICEAYEALKWQAEHFLSSFQPHVFQEFDRETVPGVELIYESEGEEKDDSSESEKIKCGEESTVPKPQSDPIGIQSLRELVNCLPGDTADKLLRHLRFDSVNPELRQACDEMLLEVVERQAVITRELEQLIDSATDCSLEAVRAALAEACDEKEEALQDTKLTSAYLYKMVAILDSTQSKTRHLDNGLLRSWLADVVLRARGHKSELKSLMLAAGNLMAAN